MTESSEQHMIELRRQYEKHMVGEWRDMYERRIADIEEFSKDMRLTPEQKRRLYGIACNLFNLPMFIYNTLFAIIRCKTMGIKT